MEAQGTEDIASPVPRASDTPSDEALARRAAALHDPAVFGELVQRHQSRVRAFLRQLARDDALADDLAQDAFLRAWNKLPTFTGKGSFRAWLMTLTRNVFLQHARKAKRDRRLLEELESGPGRDLPLPGPGTPEATGGLNDLDRFMDALSEDERSVLVLSYGFGYSHVEVAAVTGLPVGTVKSHIHRAKARIREQFALPEASNA